MTPPGGPPLRQLGENQLLARFRDLAGPHLSGGVVVGPGDDAAVLRAPGGRLLLLTCDMMVEDIHFRRAWAAPEQIGWKAMAQNLSDIAAMGGEPAAAVASLSAPDDLSSDFLDRIAQGLISAASEYGASLVGGDLVGSPGPIAVDVAVIGWVEEDHLLLRRGARPGDAILVTGSLGASAAGLALLQQGLADDPSPETARALQAHRQPVPRLAEARAIAASHLATAMMDLSDGLADDLPRLCAESGVGARVSARRLPIHPACLALASRLAKDSLALAITGGEDYQLLFTCPPDAVDAVAAAVSSAAGTTVTVIGDVTEDRGVSFLDPDGRMIEPGAGFDHFAPKTNR